MQHTLPELIAPRTLAARWGLSEKTLERWRMTGNGPTFLKLGSRVLYRMDDVSAHEAQRLRFPHIFHAASTTKRACSIEAGVGPDGAGGQPRLSTSQPIRQTLSVGRFRLLA